MRVGSVLETSNPEPPPSRGPGHEVASTGCAVLSRQRYGYFYMRYASTTLIMGACVLETFSAPLPTRGVRAWVLTFRRTICRGENLIEYFCGACGAFMVQNVRVWYILLLIVFLFSSSF